MSVELTGKGPGATRARGIVRRRWALVAAMVVLVGIACTADDGGRPERVAATMAPTTRGLVWTLIDKLTAVDGQTSDGLGISVAVSGEMAIVGAYLEDEGGKDAGAAYLFSQNQGGPDAWDEVKKLTPSTAEADALFGKSVAISGDVAIVGAPCRPIEPTCIQDKAGAAYLFERNEGGADNWGQVAKLTVKDGAERDKFGYSVAIAGDVVVVGAYREDDDTLLNAGAAYVFSRDQGGADAWGEVTKLTTGDATDYMQFGISVATSGDVAIVGAPDVDAEPYGPGAAYLFALRSANGDPCTIPSDCASGFCVGGVCCGVACDDGDYCNGPESCEGGKCVDASSGPCSPGDNDADCSETCDEESDSCSLPDPEGSSCDDNTGVCQGGLCLGLPGADCTETDACSESYCVDEVCCVEPSCAPYRCGSTGSCGQACTSTADCASGYECDAAGRCVPAGSLTGGGGCGCRLVRSPPGSGRWHWGLALLLGLGLAGLRRSGGRRRVIDPQ